MDEEGRKVTFFRGTLPDGKVRAVGSFVAYSGNPHFGCYEHDGKWWVAGVWGMKRDVPKHYTPIKADRMGDDNEEG